MSSRFVLLMSTAILSVTYRISSELRSQATAGLVSTTVGDHVGIRGAVGSLFAFVALCFAARPLFRCSRFPLGRAGAVRECVAAAVDYYTVEGAPLRRARPSRGRHSTFLAS